jgi:hypothetical protein
MIDDGSLGNENPRIGEVYGLSWAIKGCRWRLKSTDNSGNCIMVTLKSGREIMAKTKDLRKIKIK